METTQGFHSRRRVTRAFKMRGLALQSSALSAIMNVLSRESKDRGDKVLQAIVEEIRERMVSLSASQNQFVVTKNVLADVVADMSRNATDVADEALQLLDAFDTPRLAFDTTRKQFSLLTDSMETRSLFGEASDKADMFAQRYALIQQRILRQELFRPKLVTADGRHVSGEGKNITHIITPVESLLGRSGVKFLLGMIVQVEEGRYYFEDHTAQVPMDLSETSVVTDGFIAENCIMLVEGEMVDGVLHVHRMGNPIIETRTNSIDTIGLQNSDLFQSMSSFAEAEKMREQELTRGPEGMFVVLSDVHLDNPSVMEKLEVLFEGYQNMEPLPVFVFMGNFCSTPMSASRDATKTMIGYFEDLANLISNFSRLANDARFVFVPGPNDPGMANILPRPPIPQYFAGVLRAKVAHALFSTNPCRIRYFTKELVFFRQDLVHMLRRNCILKPRASNGDEFVQHAVKTILDQGHLCPLPLASCPIYWQYDHVLRLYPLPDAVIVGDVVDQFYETYAECDAVNPSSFSKDFSFVVYRPTIVSDDDGEETIRSDVEFSQIE